MLDISWLLNNITHKGIKAKISLSTRNKCVYLLEVSETSIAIWRQDYPTITIFRMCYGENGMDEIS